MQRRKRMEHIEQFIGSKYLNNGTIQKKEKEEDGTIKGEKWNQSQRYIGEWNNNVKSGYGIQLYQNGDKYEVLYLLTDPGNLGK